MSAPQALVLLFREDAARDEPLGAFDNVVLANEFLRTAPKSIAKDVRIAFIAHNPPTWKDVI